MPVNGHHDRILELQVWCDEVVYCNKIVTWKSVLPVAECLFKLFHAASSSDIRRRREGGRTQQQQKGNKQIIVIIIIKRVFHTHEWTSF